jgi:hypothetical protein
MGAPQSEGHEWEDDSSALELPPRLTLPSGPFNAQSWTEALYELEGALVQLMEALDAYLVVNVTRHDDRIRSIPHLEHGGDHGRDRSDETLQLQLHDARRLISDYEAGQLLTLGWKAPNLDPLQMAIPGSGHPNFYRTWSTDNGRPPGAILRPDGENPLRRMASRSQRLHHEIRGPARRWLAGYPVKRKRVEGSTPPAPLHP